MVSPNGEVLTKISGPVWASLPQTPQAAEHVAYAALAELLGEPAMVHSDCASVVRVAGLSVHQALDRRGPHAGIYKHS